MCVCPWWLAYTFDNRLRRLLYSPETVLNPYVKPGMTLLDLGCGMGFFSIAMARLVGDTGTVISVDLQQQILDVMMTRADHVGVAHRIHPYRCTDENLGSHAPVDFALACYMLHEVPDRARFLQQVRAALKPKARFLIMEPRFHVTKRAFATSLAIAAEAGLVQVDSPVISMSHTALLSNEA
jgi:ubiquinone/menaquinone biosynthesis C-methylase UbiE